MFHELIYTSASKGLAPGSTGFCTVARTDKTKPKLVRTLELLSDYRHARGLSDDESPVSYSLLSPEVSGVVYRVLSRTGPAGVDYSQRTNYLAHHLAVEKRRLVSSGNGDGFGAREFDPAFLLEHWEDIFTREWKGEPVTLKPRSLKDQEETRGPGVCEAWRDAAGDARWGGYLAEAARNDAIDYVTVIFAPKTDVRSLVIESLSLLEREERWDVTFSTYLTRLPPGIECKWRFVLKGTEEARRARDRLGTPLLDLSGGPMLGRPPGTGGLIEAAETGVLPAPDEDEEDEDKFDDLFEGEDDDNRLFGGKSFEQEDEFVDVEELEPSSDFRDSPEPDSPPVQGPPIQTTRSRGQRPPPNPIVFGGVAAGVVAVIAIIVIYFLVILPGGGGGPEPDDADNGGSASGVKQDGGAQRQKAKEKAIEEIDGRIDEAEAMKDRAATNRTRAIQLHERLKDRQGDVDRWNGQITKLRGEFDDAKDDEDVKAVQTKAVEAEGLRKEIRNVLSQLERDRDELQREWTRLREDVDTLKSWRNENSQAWESLDIPKTVGRLDKAIGIAADALNTELYNDVRDDLASVADVSQQVSALSAEMRQAIGDMEPVAGVTEPNSQDAFRDVPEGGAAFDLPEPGTLAAASESRVLCSLFVDDPSDCSLDLLGPVRPDGTVFRLAPPTDEQGKRAWQVLADNGLESQRIATLALENQSLSFVWWKSRGRSHDDQQLKNCVVKISAGNRIRTAQLRSVASVKLPGSELNFENAYFFAHEFPITVYPCNCDIVFEISAHGFPDDGFRGEPFVARLETGRPLKAVRIGEAIHYEPCGQCIGQDQHRTKADVQKRLRRTGGSSSRPVEELFFDIPEDQQRDGTHLKLRFGFAEVYLKDDWKAKKEERAIWVRAQLSLSKTASECLASTAAFEPESANRPVWPSWLRQVKGKKDADLREAESDKRDAIAKSNDLNSKLASASPSDRRSIQTNINEADRRSKSAEQRIKRLEKQRDCLKELIRLLGEITVIQGRIYASYEKHKVELVRFSAKREESAAPKASEQTSE